MGMVSTLEPDDKGTLFQKEKEPLTKITQKELDELTDAELEAYTRIRRKKGYDVRGAKDVREIFSKDIERGYDHSTDKEGLEVIDFLKKQNQISSNTVKELKDKITKEGIRSFGPLRSVNYYYRKAAENRSKKTIRKRYPSLKDDQT